MKQTRRCGQKALLELAAGRVDTLQDDIGAVASLEAIIRTDGSRPSFLVRNGKVDQATSPVGDWANTLAFDAGMLTRALQCVGRIDLPSSRAGYKGTGFLIQEDLIVTNRHVLQEIAFREGAQWRLRGGAAIDFGREYRGIESLNRRSLSHVVYSGPETIREPVDHRRLDLAMIALTPATADVKPRHWLSIDRRKTWHQSGQEVYVVGYPTLPEPNPYPLTLLEQLFQTTFGYKRLAPGKSARSTASDAAWTMGHDCTTIVGNSGSLVIGCGEGGAALAIHYGGVRGETGENWGHVLGSVLDYKAPDSNQTLGDLLAQRRVAVT